MKLVKDTTTIVKELVKILLMQNITRNSVSQGGKSIIQVKIMGGEFQNELPTAVCRHATSKLIDNEISMTILMDSGEKLYHLLRSW